MQRVPTSHNPFRGDRGFTLLEVMVVVLIIGILLAVGIPTYLGARGRAQDRAAEATVATALQVAVVLESDRSINPGMAITDLLAAFGAAEPAFQWVGASQESTGPKVASVAVGDTYRFKVAVRSDSGTCFSASVDNRGVVTRGESDTGPCSASGSVTSTPSTSTTLAPPTTAAPTTSTSTTTTSTTTTTTVPVDSCAEYAEKWTTYYIDTYPYLAAYKSLLYNYFYNWCPS